MLLPQGGEGADLDLQLVWLIPDVVQEAGVAPHIVAEGVLKVVRAAQAVRRSQVNAMDSVPSLPICAGPAPPAQHAVQR